jgi:hypothetical protein
MSDLIDIRLLKPIILGKNLIIVKIKNSIKNYIKKGLNNKTLIRHITYFIGSIEKYICGIQVLSLNIIIEYTVYKI